MSSERQLGLNAALGLWAALALAAAFYGTGSGYGGRPFAFALAVFAFYLASVVLFAARGASERLASLARRPSGVALIFLPLLAYLIYAVGTNTFTWTRAGLAAVIILAPSLVLVTARDAPAGAWQDYAAIVLIWAPVKFRWHTALWAYPEMRLGYVFTVLVAMNVALFGFLLLRRLEKVGYTLGWGRGWGFEVGFNFLVLAAILISLGQAIHFIRFEPAWGQLRSLPLTALGILLFTGWPEEFLFRGLLQNLLAQTLRNANRGWLAASVLFGLAHITNYGFPNWRYVILATIAGVFYGRAWRKTGSILPAALVHMLVDAAWHFFFRTL